MALEKLYHFYQYTRNIKKLSRKPLISHINDIFFSGERRKRSSFPPWWQTSWQNAEKNWEKKFEEFSYSIKYRRWSTTTYVYTRKILQRKMLHDGCVKKQAVYKKKQEQTMYSDLRRRWNNSDKVVRKISLLFYRSVITQSWVLDPSLKRFLRTKSSRKKLTCVEWSMKPKYCTVDKQLSNCSPTTRKTTLTVLGPDGFTAGKNVNVTTTSWRF